ncbi:MAG: hypothetical protein WEA36_11040 [Balneolaceae bacterium]
MAEREPWLDTFREKLHHHQEPYQLGAWEQFETHRASRIRARIRRRVASVAAVLLVGIGLFWFATPGTQTGDEMALRSEEPPMLRELESRSSMPAPSATDDPPEEGIVATEPDVVAGASSNGYASGEGGPSRGGESSVVESVQPEEGAEVTDREGSTHTFADAGQEAVEDVPPIWIDSPITGRMLGVRATSRIMGESEAGAPVISGINRFVATRRSSQTAGAGNRETTSTNDSKAVRVSDLRLDRSDRPFAWGVAYSPMMNLHGGTARMAMGAGVHARVELGQSWGLGSALVLSRSQFQTDAEPGDANLFQTRMMASGAPTILNSRMEADLVSLEVPLNLRYEVSETVAFSGGLSTVAYLQETYRYLVDYRQSYVTASSTEQGIRFESGERERTERVSESEAPMSGVYWGAFYNMGAEFSWIVSNRHLVSVEPFVKIPSGGVATRDLTYSSGGVQLKLYF